MLNLDQILQKTVINNFSDKEIASKTKEFLNNSFDEKHEKKLEKKKNVVNNCDQIKKYSILKKNMVIGYMKKKTDIFCEGRIMDIFYKNKNIDYIEIYNFVLKKKENINTKTHNLYLFNKYNKDDGELKNYSYVENIIILEKGQFIKYINKKRITKILCGGRIEEITYDKDKKKIDEISLYNFIANKKWKIKAENYYIYVYDNIEKQINIINKNKNDLLNLIKNIE
jgi:hypothetical protein